MCSPPAPRHPPLTFPSFNVAGTPVGGHGSCRQGIAGTRPVSLRTRYPPAQQHPCNNHESFLSEQYDRYGLDRLCFFTGTDFGPGFPGP